MNFDNPIVWAVAGVIALCLIAFFTSYLSSEARLERRRRRSNARIVSKTNRPAVKFSVKTKDSEK